MIIAVGSFPLSETAKGRIWECANIGSAHIKGVNIMNFLTEKNMRSTKKQITNFFQITGRKWRIVQFI